MNCPECGAAIAKYQEACIRCGAATLQEEPSDAAPANVSGDVEAALPPMLPFFSVSLWKLAVMSFFTLGLYDLYWFYRNWQRVRVREQRDIRPSVRVLFAVIFCYFCFRRIRRYGLAVGLRSGPPILVLAIFWVAAKLAGVLPMPIALLSVFGTVFLLPMQAYVNRIHAIESPNHDPNARFTILNWVWILVGAGLLLLNLLRLLLPATDAPPA